MIKYLFTGLGIVLMMLTVCSCSDDNYPEGGGGGGQDQKDGYTYNVTIPRGVETYVIILDSITGDVKNISTESDWVSAKQEGQDGEQHPVLFLNVDSSVKEARYAVLTARSIVNQKIVINVKQKAFSVMGEDYTPEVTYQNKDFYENWYEGSDGQVYITETNNSATWSKRNLPWRENALGSIPAEVLAEMRYHKDDWKLVYSTLGLQSTSGCNFFTLYNDKLSKLRFFYYIPGGYITIGSSATFAIDIYNPKGKMALALNSNETLVMPDELQNSGKLNSSKTQTYMVVPIGVGDDRTITSGWTCFDLDADHGYTDVTKEAFEDPDTKMTVRLMTTLLGDFNLDVALGTTGYIDMSGVSIVQKGDGLAAAATFFNGLGNSAYQVGSGIASLGEGALGKAGGIVQIVGGGSSLVGTALSTIQAADDAIEYCEGTASVVFNTTGRITGNVSFNTINGLPGITFSPIAFKYNWETLLSDKPTKWATDNSLPTFGLMNVIDNPVVYVSSDHLIYTPASMSPLYQLTAGNELIERSGDDEQLRYISFLDPSSVEMFFNKEMMGYDFEHAEISVSVTANAGPYDKFFAPTPYFNYYQLRNDQIQLTTNDTSYENIFGSGDTKSMKLVSCPNSDIPTVELTGDPDFEAEYTFSNLPCFDKSEDVLATGFSYRYYGLTGTLFNGSRRVIVDPIIYVPTNGQHLIYNKSYLGPIYVTVVARLTKSDGSMQIISKHYLPEIRTFSSEEIGDIKTRINNFNPSTVKTCKGTATADYIDVSWLKARALKMLELAAE